MTGKQKEEKEIADFFIKYFITEHNIDKNSIIPLAEEMVLIEQAQNGSKRSFEIILNTYRWLINETCVIYRNFRPEINSNELTAKALESLRKSIMRYDLNANYRFAVYAMEGIALAFGVDTELAEPYQKNG